MALVAVAVLDEDNWLSNTDVIVVVDTRKRRLTWVPRDLWSDRTDDRINQAFRRGGGKLLAAALGDLGFPVQGVLCLRRAATEAALADLDVVVPVNEPLDYWYPLKPGMRTQDGRKHISFRPPEERLTGERVHQWIGARKAVFRDGSDLQRLQRQAILLQVLLKSGFEFRRVVSDPELVAVWGRDPFAVLAGVLPDWRFIVFDKVVDSMVRDKIVLRPRRPFRGPRIIVRKLLTRLRLR